MKKGNRYGSRYESYIVYLIVYLIYFMFISCLCAVFVIIKIILAPFIWVSDKRKDEKKLIEDQENREKLISFVGLENIFITDPYFCPTVKIYFSKHILKISLHHYLKNKEFLKKNFPKEWKKACWIRDIEKKLRNDCLEQWESLLELTWAAIEYLEKRNHFTENKNNLISLHNLNWIKKFSDKALIGLRYKSNNDKYEQLIQNIMIEIKILENEKSNFTDIILKESMQLVIETHKKRLETQIKIKNTINLIDNDIKRLNATYNLIVESVKAEISAFELNDSRIKTKWNDSLLSINLSALDMVYEEYSKEFSKSEN